MNHAELMDKAMQMAELDYRANGNYLNAPYKVRDEDGDRYLAKVRETPEGCYLLLVRPETVVDSVGLGAARNGQTKAKKVVPAAF